MMAQRTYISKHAHLRMFTHCACIYYNNIGISFICGKSVAHAREHTAHDVAVGFVLLTAVAVHQRKALSACLGSVRAVALEYLHYIIILYLKFRFGNDDFGSVSQLRIASVKLLYQIIIAFFCVFDK